MDKIFCVQCETCKPASGFNKEHIVPCGFGNDGESDATLENKICALCNANNGNVIDQPFVRNIISREIARDHKMKRRKKKTKLRVSGSGVVVRYETSVAHLFECIKIAFETHIKFLSDEYRDDIFHDIRKLLLDIIADYDCMQVNLKDNQPLRGRGIGKIWAETGQAVVAAKHFETINNYVYRLDELVGNSEDIVREVQTRSSKGTYASLVQRCCIKSKIFVLIILQSLPPLAIHVSNEADKYVKQHEYNGIHVMDLRSSDKWIGYEKNVVRTIVAD